MANIIEKAKEAGNFKTLLKAVDVAGLTETLSSKGPFTVFAPTDDAFQKIPQDQLNSIINNKEMLTSILKYHVVSGKMTSDVISQKKSLDTLQGGKLTVETSGGSVMVGGARVTQADIEVSNGVCHAIDSVMVPKEVQVPASR